MLHSKPSVYLCTYFAQSQTRLKRLSSSSSLYLGFSGGWDGKESASNAGDLGSIPGSGRSSGEGNSIPLIFLFPFYFLYLVTMYQFLMSMNLFLFCTQIHLHWASIVAQTVKNLPAVQETQVRSLGQEDPLEKVLASHSSILAWRIPWTEEPDRLQSMGHRVRHNWVTNTFTFLHLPSA